ncbi:unnamed protein product [Ilex paraguariensis]|uniref:DUF7722 domain-containing protein n=1 Tax=Ilex paraguariensis TaxID=185542 RepID=A0ABC8QSG0_9AQUA
MRCMRSIGRERRMDGKKNSSSGGGGGISFFQMPLHYPRYTKKDYEAMPEWMLDRLLAEYGLSAHGDLAFKREFAMGAFLWSNVVQGPPKAPKSSLYQSFEYFLHKKNV